MLSWCKQNQSEEAQFGTRVWICDKNQSRNAASPSRFTCKVLATFQLNLPSS